MLATTLMPYARSSSTVESAASSRRSCTRDPALPRAAAGHRDHRAPHSHGSLARSLTRVPFSLLRCNVIWAYATCGIEANDVLDLSAADMVHRLDEFSPQGIANALWSFATLGHASPPLFDATARAAIPRLDDFNQQELSLTAWAYATMEMPAPALFDALAVQATRRVTELNPQAVSNMAWAYATVGHPAPAMFDALTNQMLRQIRYARLFFGEVADFPW